MESFGKRTLVTVTVALVVVLGVAAVPAAAAGAGASESNGADDRESGEQESGDRERGQEDDNSSFNLSLSAQVGPAGGSGYMDCTGDPTRHSCDKQGEFDGGPASMDYEGDNYGDFHERTGGGGDAFVVTVAGQEFVVFFDCDFGPGPSDSDCTGDVLTPAGDVPA